MKNNRQGDISNFAPEVARALSQCHVAKGDRARLAAHYQCAIRDYLDHPEGEYLQCAYELGCIALRSGMGVFDLARLHGEILAKTMRTDLGRAEAARQGRAAETFLLDALSPFESARRGLPDVYTRLGQVNKTLAQRNKELAAIVARQYPMEEALLASNERYIELFQKTRSMKEEIRQHSANMVAAQEEERKRLSRDLHDEIGQVLAAMNMGLVMLKKQAGSDRSMLRQVAATQILLKRSMDSVHRFARDLRPTMLDLFGPYEAIRSYVKAFADRSSIIATVEAKIDFGGLDSEQQIVLFRVAQESITNISKHAHATRVDVRFHREPGRVCMEIQDNGRSFSVAEKMGEKGAKRLGLLGMQERVRLVRGDFSIESSPEHGTTVRVTLPLAVNKTPAPLNGHGAGAVSRKPASSLKRRPTHEKNNRLIGG